MRAGAVALLVAAVGLVAWLDVLLRHTFVREGRGDDKGGLLRAMGDTRTEIDADLSERVSAFEARLERLRDGLAAADGAPRREHVSDRRDFTAPGSRTLRPNLAFIKTMKTGSTTVQYALMHAAAQYKIHAFRENATAYLRSSSSRTREVRLLEYSYANVESRSLAGSDANAQQPHGTLEVKSASSGYGHIWWYHGAKSRWMDQIMPNARYVTILRDPVEQTLSYLNYELHYKDYVPHTRACSAPRSLAIRLANVPLAVREFDDSPRARDEGCYDAEYRRNATLIVVGAMLHDYGRLVQAYPFLRLWFGPGDVEFAVKGSVAWIADFDRQYFGFAKYYDRRRRPPFAYEYPQPAELVGILQREYFLVGVTERMDEFIVLLALAHGWSLPSMYYVPCKKSAISLRASDIALHFPELAAKLRASLSATQEAYEWARTSFDAYVRSLGPWFRKVMQEFKAGLREFQRTHTADSFAHLTLVEGIVVEC